MFTRGIGRLLIALLLVPALLPAQAPQQPLTEKQKKERALAAEFDVDAAEIVALEKEMAHAIALNDPSFFQRVYSDDYVGTAATGETRDKNAVVARIQGSAIKYSNFIVTNINVRVYGASAVATCTWTARGEFSGRTFARQYRVMHVYYNNNVSGWKVVASQETQMPG
jgi:ketosteroid isomerase-like protein